MPTKYKSKLMEETNQNAIGSHKAGTMHKITMREFDRGWLTPIQRMTPQRIRGLRIREAGTQTVFAALLNVTPTLIKRWESGEAEPRGACLKLLTLVEKKGLEFVA